MQVLISWEISFPPQQVCNPAFLANIHGFSVLNNLSRNKQKFNQIGIIELKLRTDFYFFLNVFHNTFDANDTGLEYPKRI